MNKRWIVPAIVLAALILAGALRWDYIGEKTTSGGITQWYEDRWTGETWIRYYSSVYKESPITNYGSSIPGKIKDYTTTAWEISVWASALWLVLSLKPKKSKDEPRIQ